jgi:hypothetical protein
LLTDEVTIHPKKLLKKKKKKKKKKKNIDNKVNKEEKKWVGNTLVRRCPEIGSHV